MEKNNLKTLWNLGQSPWYDNIDRNILQNGKLKELIDKGVTGVTSNPSIFEKAVNSSSIYDETVLSLSKQGKSVQEIYDIVTVQDIQSAADLLRGVYALEEGPSVQEASHDLRACHDVLLRRADPELPACQEPWTSGQPVGADPAAAHQRVASGDRAQFHLAIAQ